MVATLANAMEIPPLVGFKNKKFQLNNVQQITPVGSGYVQTVERSSPLWIAEYETKPLNDAAYDQMIDFMLGLDTSMNTFLGYDPSRVMPRAYQSMATTADPWKHASYASPRINAWSYTDSSITLDNMAVGVTITKGDYISVYDRGIWHLFRSRETVVTADGGAGGWCVLTVRPRPMLVASGFAATAIRYRRPVCEMKMIQPYEETDEVSGLPYFRFKAGQFINRSDDAATDDLSNLG